MGLALLNITAHEQSKSCVRKLKSHSYCYVNEIQARIQEWVKGGGGHFSKVSTRVAKMSISISLAYSHGEVYIRMLLAYSIFL